jgi:hypothetical protein
MHIEMLLQAALAALHIVFVCAAALALFPLPGLQTTAMSWAFRLSIILHGIRLLRRCPPPKRAKDIPQWLQACSATTELFYLLGDLILISVRSGSFFFLSQSILATYHASFLLNQMSTTKFSVFYKNLCARRPTALLWMGLLDIATLLQLIILVFTTGQVRILFQTMVYTNLLRSRYQGSTPEFDHHRESWRWLHSIIPSNPVMDFITSWFCGSK